MLPRAERTVKRLQVSLQRARPLAPVLAWGLALWAAVIAVPLGFLYPDAGLDQPACLVLACLAPVGMIAAALSGTATAVLGVGLAGLVPLLIACPELQGPRTTGPLQALLVGLLAVGFTAVAWAQTSQRTQPGLTLRRLAVWPRDHVERLLILLGMLWLAEAWLVRGLEAQATEGARAARVAGVAVCWLAVRLVPLRGDLPELDPHAPRDRWPMYAGRRVAWLALCTGLLWLWRKHV